MRLPQHHRASRWPKLGQSKLCRCCVDLKEVERDTTYRRSYRHSSGPCLRDISFHPPHPPPPPPNIQSHDSNLWTTMQMKAIEQYFHALVIIFQHFSKWNFKLFKYAGTLGAKMTKARPRSNYFGRVYFHQNRLLNLDMKTNTELILKGNASAWQTREVSQSDFHKYYRKISVLRRWNWVLETKTNGGS